MTTEENKALIRSAMDAVWNKGNFSFGRDVYAENYRFHDPANPDVDTAAEVARLAMGYRTLFPYVHITIDAQLAEGDLVTTRWTIEGSQSPDGAANDESLTVTVTGIMISRIENAKIAEEWMNWDALGLMHQLGAIHLPALQSPAHA